MVAKDLMEKYKNSEIVEALIQQKIQLKMCKPHPELPEREARS